MSQTQIVKNKLEFNWKEFVCGWSAAIINVSVTYPINKVIFRQMLHGIDASAAYRQLRHEGMYYLYRGMLPPLCQKSLSLSLMFGVYEQVRQPLIQYDLVGGNAHLAKILAGMAAGTCEALLTPFERIQTILANARYHNVYKNTAHTFLRIRATHGYAEFYRGVAAILLRNGPSNAGFFLMREHLQTAIAQHQQVSAIWRVSAEFLGGAVIGVVLSTLFYPLNVIKVAAQQRIGGHFESPAAIAMRIYRARDRKLRHFYHGVQMNCTRAFLSWGVMNVAYEQVKNVIY